MLLSNSYHTGNQTELDFMDCLNNSILKKQDTFEIIPTRQFQNLFYPWFEPSTAPQSIEDLPKILGNELIKEKLSVMKIKYLIKITGFDVLLYVMLLVVANFWERSVEAFCC